MYQISHEQLADAAAIENLLEKCFGPDRFKKTAYKIRKPLEPVKALSLVVREKGQLLASIRYWPVTVGEKLDALLLGPIVVEPDRQGEGIGVALIRQSLQHARNFGCKAVILVGDPDYYQRFGFVSAFGKGLLLPGPVEEHRFLVCELEENILEGIDGMVRGNPSKAHPLTAFAPPCEA
ncbi:MAG: N-acetyltransferase [Sneathiella sp.]